MARRKRYTDKFRADAVVMVEAMGYPEQKGALSEVAKHLGISHQLLSNWVRAKQNPPPQELLQEKKGELADELESIVWLLTDHMKSPDTIGDMSGQATATSIGIMVDKIRLLRGLPTEIVQIMPDLLEAIKRLGQEPSDVFNRIIERAARLNR